MTDAATGAAETPLQDHLRRIPRDAIYQWVTPEADRELWQLPSNSAPIGRLAHEAADLLDLAALSPEAPAREGERKGFIWKNLHGQECIGWILPKEFMQGSVVELCALTPRHEAPAATLDKHMSPSPSQIADAADAKHEAPAEGAGEVEAIARLMCRQHYGDRGYSTPGILNVVESDWPAWKEKAEEVIALRARSSAPEAREGEAVAVTANDMAQMTCFANNHGTLEDWAVWCRIRSALTTHPAAPSADKLLDALRDQSWDLRCFNIPTGGDDFDIGWRVIGHWQAEPRERTIAEVFTDDPAEAVRQALAALKAEGA